MTTVGTIVQAAGRKLGVTGMTAAEIADGISALNNLLLEWQAIPSLKNAVTRQSFSITASTASYAVGEGEAIDTVWPTRIKAAFIRDSDNVDHPISVFSAEEYAYTGQKADKDMPAALYYERSYPSGTFFFWPTPDQAYTVYLWSHKIYTAYTATDDDLDLPPEYEPAMIYNLAIELSPEFEKPVSQAVAIRAASTMKTIKNMNAHPIPQIRTDSVCGIGGGSSKSLFAGYYSDRVGWLTLPFVLRA